MAHDGVERVLRQLKEMQEVSFDNQAAQLKDTNVSAMLFNICVDL